MGITRPDGPVATRNYILPVGAAGFAFESFGDSLSSRWEESSSRKHVRIAVQSPIESGRCFSYQAELLIMLSNLELPGGVPRQEIPADSFWSPTSHLYILRSPTDSEL